MINVGPYQLKNRVVLAPMAGVTDLPFRLLCRRLGAGHVVGEMVTSDSRLWHTPKSQWRMNHSGEPEPRTVQIAGGDPQMMADAALANQLLGAQIIDINMGCPKKKVCNKLAGSALLKDEGLVKEILHATVEAVDVPVTLKIRTGWDKDHINGLRIAELAQDAGIKMLAVHGRTRTCGYQGQVEYDTIRDIKAAIDIPVLANGDITTAQKAQQVLDYTGADGVMIGRAAQGNPWIFREIEHYLNTGTVLKAPDLSEVEQILIDHLHQLHVFYGDFMGCRIARKHVGWYLQTQDNSRDFRKLFNQLEIPVQQIQAVQEYFARLKYAKEIAA